MSRPRFEPLGWLLKRWIPPSEVRTETWLLGNRHKGDVEKGVRLELAAAKMTARRAVLLRLVLHHARNGGASS